VSLTQLMEANPRAGIIQTATQASATPPCTPGRSSSVRA
jgi:membrane glycosyltransferase